MGLKEMQILFDNPWASYYAGSAVKGQLVLNLDSPKKVREIKVKFKGEAHVWWTENESYTNSEGKSENRSVSYSATETYFENKYNLAGETEIPPGSHTYDFSTILPPVLPTSYEGAHGHIRYTVKVVLDRPWKFDQECKAAFTVITPVDLNTKPEARMPLMIEKEKTVGMCCCKSGPLSGTISAPVSGYTSGQTVPVTVEIVNSTNTNVTKGKCYFNKIVTYKSTSPSSKTKKERVEIAKFDLGAVGSHGSNTWTENFLIPPLPATNIGTCDIIKLSYEIEVKTSVSGLFCRGLDFSAPFLIGSIPLITYGGEPVAPPTGGQTIGWNPNGVSNLYPNLPPPSYQESQHGKAASIQDKDDNEHTIGIGGWVPVYPTFDVTPSAPPKQ